MTKKKSLSQQICKLCGMEPKCRTNETNKHCAGMVECEECADKLLPNFENPENFVKLLELKILTGCYLWGYLSLKGIYLSHRQGFLKTLLIYLEQNLSDAELIKQSIRDYDGWVWG